MPTPAPRPRIIILANLAKPAVHVAVDELRAWLADRAEVVAEPDVMALTPASVLALPEADLIIVLGGDGTVIGQARNVLSLGLPVLGVNFGKFGFLTEFTLADVRRHWDSIATLCCGMSRRVMVEAMVFPAGHPTLMRDGIDPARARFHESGLNEAVINAGEPFHVIELGMQIDPTAEHDDETSFGGDGIIVATPSGSTAYNLSASGPILDPEINALCITPLAAHSLAFRPIVVGGDCVIRLRVHSANVGTTLTVDGQRSTRLAEGEQVIIRRHDRTLTLLRNPSATYWRRLATKLHWAAQPRG